MPTPLPVIIEPEELQQRLGESQLLVVDLSRVEIYAAGHIPGAVHLDYRQLIRGTLPAPGLLPPLESLAASFAAIGLTPDHQVVAYDDEGGGKAGRLLWTLDVVGHAAASVLNGGLHAWANEGHPLTADPVPREPSSYPLSYGDDALASKSELLALLGDPSLGLLDARTPEEFAGTKVRAARGGRIPGAANLNWLDTMDRGRNLRLLPDEQLRTLLRARGLTPEKLIVSYCHTHHRSAHSYVMLKHLGYDRIKAYAGSWSEWGNDPATPVEQG